MPSVFTSITRRHSAASISSNGRRFRVEKIAALLTRMSTPPNSAVAISAKRGGIHLRGDVDFQTNGAMAGCPQPLCSLPCASLIGDDDVGTTLRKIGSDRMTDALGTAGDDRDLARKGPALITHAAGS